MQKLDLKKGISKNSSLLSLVIAYIIMLIVFSLISPYFMTIGNVMNIGMNTAINGITATAMTLVIILGGLDVSVGSVMAITNMAVSVLSVQMGFGIELIFIALGIGLACGAINGLLITKVG
ncbi:MAG: ABC transporter permease, partial [Christensenella sp.]